MLRGHFNTINCGVALPCKYSVIIPHVYMEQLNVPYTCVDWYKQMMEDCGLCDVILVFFQH